MRNSFPTKVLFCINQHLIIDWSLSKSEYLKKNTAEFSKLMNRVTRIIGILLNKIIVTQVMTTEFITSGT